MLLNDHNGSSCKTGLYYFKSFLFQIYKLTLMQAFDILNINRMTSGIDTYGQGRCPFFLETSVIVLITDGGKLTTGCKSFIIIR